MWSLRRRVFGLYSPESSPVHSRESSPAPGHSHARKDSVQLVPTRTLKRLQSQSKIAVRGRKRRNAWVFGLGGLFGILLAASFATPTGSIDKIVELAGLRDMHLDSVLDVIPLGLIRDVRNLQVSRNKMSLFLD